MIATVRPQHYDAGLTGRQGLHLSMPTSMANPLDVSARRVPRLAVRSPSDEIAVSDVTQFNEDNNVDSQRMYLQPGFSTSNHGYLSSPGSSTPTSYHDRPRHGFGGSQRREQPRRSHQASKKKSAGVLGFLTLKEPSTSALGEFAEQEKRKAAQKGAKSIAMVMPGVSSQRLPDHVPKVNSKWDGLPETARRRPKEKDASHPLDLGSFSLSRSGSNWRASTGRPYGSLSSKPSVRHSQDRSGSMADGMEIRHASLYSPPLARSAIRTSPSPSDLDLPDLSGYTITSPEASPRTPAVDSAVPLPTLGGPYSATAWQSDSDDVTVRSAGPNILGLPKMRAQSLQPSNIPNYYAAAGSGATSGSQSPRSLNVPLEYSQLSSSSMVSKTSARPVPSPTSSSTSSSSSAMSAQWRSPPKERLSLGPQIKKDEVLPWEKFDAPAEQSEVRSPSVSNSSNKLKRLSYRLGRK